MAQYDANRYRGFSNYGISEPRYAMVGYSEESHFSKTEQVVEYGGHQGMHGLTRKPYKDDHHPWMVKTQDRPKKGDNSSPKYNQGKHAPSWNLVHWDNNSPRAGKTHNNFSSDESDDEEEDVVCENGVCYRKPKHGPKNGYAPHNYTDRPHSSSSPRKAYPHHDTSYPSNYPSGNYGQVNPSNYTNGNYGQVNHTHPKTTDPYHDTSYPNNHYNSNPNGGYALNPPPTSYSPNKQPMGYNNLPPVKTRPSVENHQIENMRNSPVHVGSPRSPFASSPRSPYASSPRKERETIDSAEARRRYGGAAALSGGAAPAEPFSGVIDSQEAAKKYKGVFVNY